MPIVGRADPKNSGITAHTPRANSAETSGRNAVPALPCHVKRSDHRAVIVAHKAELYVLIRADISRWGKVISELGITAEQ